MRSSNPSTARAKSLCGEYGNSCVCEDCNPDTFSESTGTAGSLKTPVLMALISIVLQLPEPVVSTDSMSAGSGPTGCGDPSAVDLESGEQRALQNSGILWVGPYKNREQWCRKRSEN